MLPFYPQIGLIIAYERTTTGKDHCGPCFICLWVFCEIGLAPTHLFLESHVNCEIGEHLKGWSFICLSFVLYLGHIMVTMITKPQFINSSEYQAEANDKESCAQI